MKRLEFKESVTRRIYDDYMQRAEECVKILTEHDQSEAMLEINSHIHERLAIGYGENEADRLMDVLEKLGKPEDYLLALVADKKLHEATSTFKPIAVYHALMFNIRNGFIYSLFGILYLFLLVFVFLIGAKIIAPAKTGLFFKEGVFHSFGLRGSSDGLNEIMGLWFIPAVAVAAVLFYITITLLLRLTRK